MDKRKCDRIDIAPLEATVSDGYATYIGKVSNLSYTGMRVENLPRESINDSGEIFFTIRTKGEGYTLRAIPRWSSTLDGNNRMGFQIYCMPRSWISFLNSLE